MSIVRGAAIDDPIFVNARRQDIGLLRAKRPWNLREHIRFMYFEFYARIEDYFMPLPVAFSAETTDQRDTR